MAESVLNQEPKTNQSVDKQNQNATLKKIMGVILSVIMVALTIYALNLQRQSYTIVNQSNGLAEVSNSRQAANYRAYVNEYKETKVQLEETTNKLAVVTQQLDQVSGELATTKGMLGETQVMLSAAQEENARLKEEIGGLEALRNSENVQNIPELEAKISALKQKNVEVTSQLNGVKTELRAFEADFSSLDEGKSLVTLFQNKIKLVKSRMRYLRQEAYFAKIAAQKERDRIESMNGNNGFLVKDGVHNINGQGKGFAIDVKIVP